VCVCVCVVAASVWTRADLSSWGGPGVPGSGFFHAIGSGSGARRDSFERPPEWGQWEGAWVKAWPRTRLALGL
jgi:hypothetical protein